jgi:hypothetical protein
VWPDHQQVVLQRISRHPFSHRRADRIRSSPCREARQTPRSAGHTHHRRGPRRSHVCARHKGSSRDRVGDFRPKIRVEAACR